MSGLFVGDKSRFAIESYIAQPFERLSQRALGYFLVHVGGQVYGVRSPQATLLACSFDAVNRRLAHRGTHVASFGMEESAKNMVNCVHAALYEDEPAEGQFWGMSQESLGDELAAHEIILAPDGDAAFDDGSHVLQFDQGERVRLVAFKNSSDAASGTDSLADVTMDAAEFYQILEDWRDRFELAWRSALNEQEEKQRTI
jgi:hypothetical protein